MEDNPELFQSLQIPDSWKERGLDESAALEILQDTSKSLFLEVTKQFRFENLEEERSQILKSLSDTYTFYAVSNLLNDKVFRNKIGDLLNIDENFAEILDTSENKLGNNVLQHLRSNVEPILEVIKRKYIFDKTSQQKLHEDKEEQDIPVNEKEEKKDKPPKVDKKVKHKLIQPKKPSKNINKQGRYSVHSVEHAASLPPETTYIHISKQKAATRKNLLQIVDLLPSLKRITVAHSFFERFWSDTSAQKYIEKLTELGITIESDNIQYSPYYENTTRKTFEANIEEANYLVQFRKVEYTKILDMDIRSARIFDRYFFGEDKPSISKIQVEFGLSGTDPIYDSLRYVLDYLRNPEKFLKDGKNNLAATLKREQSEKDYDELLAHYSVMDLEGGIILPPNNLTPYKFFRWQQAQKKLILDSNFLSNKDYSSLDEEESDVENISIRNNTIVKRYLLLNEYRDQPAIELEELAELFNVTRETIRKIITQTFFRAGLDYFEEDKQDEEYLESFKDSQIQEFPENPVVVYSMEDISSLSTDVKYIHISDHSVASTQKLEEILQFLPQLSYITMPTSIYEANVSTRVGKEFLKKLKSLDIKLGRRNLHE